MRRPSVAQQLSDAERRRVAALTPSERVALALELGRRDLELFARARGLSIAEARRVQERARQAGRRLCRCIEDLIG